jgi:hypothetical protein
LTTPYRLSLLSNINNNPLARKACAAHPGLGQRALYTLTSAPGLLARRGMTLTELSAQVGITIVNLSILKNGRAR